MTDAKNALPLSSPYILPSVTQLRQAGHLVSVIIPDQQRSWIGKAHFVNRPISTRTFRPEFAPDLDRVESKDENSTSDDDEWILVDGSPASCTQLGLFHLFQDRPSIDLVISGPNYGRNTTALFSLSSGTIGGAMEAATYGYRAIAISFAFTSRDHDAIAIAEACMHSVRLVEHLCEHWGDGVDLYSVNIPLGRGIAGKKIIVTNMLQNQWGNGSCFEEIDTEEQNENGSVATKGNETKPVEGSPRETRSRTRTFVWSPDFAHVQATVKASEPGNDGWAVMNGFTSITPLIANFKHATNIPLGELTLKNIALQPSIVSRATSNKKLTIILDADEYLKPILRNTLSQLLRPDEYDIVSYAEQASSTLNLFQILPYEQIDFDRLMQHPDTTLANAYVIRKALIRKHYLWQTVSTWLTKHPDDKRLKGHVPFTEIFELDYAEFLDDALVECWDLKASLDQNAGRSDREWWLLKPAMSDQGQGLRLFSSMEDLTAIFEQWEIEHPDENEEVEAADEAETVGPMSDQELNRGSETMTSQLRHFTAQKYVAKPLLLPSMQDRKFHIRTYVLAVGALQVYVFTDMLALFAPKPYEEPVQSDSEIFNSEIHLTNTCLQEQQLAGKTTSAARFADLSADCGIAVSGYKDWKTAVIEQICDATAALFEAAAREQMIHFQVLPNAFETFGLDWLVDETGHVWLLEVNAYPDFKQSGPHLSSLVANFWLESLRIALQFFKKGASLNDAGEPSLRKVLDISLGR